ncbi:MAG: M20/M25/M40 family metallo-hydrolase [Bacteroidota bacterium]
MKYLLLFLSFVTILGAQQERRLSNLRQLTFGGSNAEAYFSSDGKQLIYQSTKEPYKCDQIFTMNTDGSNSKLVSTGEGRTTCGYFFPDGKILYASTHDDDDDCPPTPDRSKGYVWGVFNAYDIYIANADGSNPKKLSATDRYDAEATVSPDGKQVVFTSSRNGDLDLFVMNADGSNVRQLTNETGYDGGAFFSPDGKMIVYRAYHPTDPKELAAGKALLNEELVKPEKMELFVINADGTGKRQVTHNGAANFAPYFTPDGKKIIFASNIHDPEGYDFDLFLIGIDGKDMEQITYSKGFDGFPMFSPDGKQLVFVSSRNAKARHEFNIFIADWVQDSAGYYLRQHEAFLASDKLEGRKSGTESNVEAARYIEREFANIGLAPFGDNQSYFQNFEVVSKLELGAKNALVLQQNKKKTTYTVDSDFRPIGFSSDTAVTAGLVFAGYGISADDLKYDDYASVNVANKIVIVMRGSPEDDTPHSQFGKFSALRYKAMNARQKGAVGLLVVNPATEDSADKLIELKYDNSFSTSGIATAHVKRSVVNAWLKANRISVDSLSAQIQRTKKPNSFELKKLGVSLSTEIVKVKNPTQNVVAILKVPNAVPNEHLIIGAHFDHLGFGGEGSGSLEPSKQEIHNGADDNASGTAAMIEIARYLQDMKNSLKRDIVFIGFSGEEMGLLGSSYYTKSPSLPLEQAVTMINLDMVGRLKDHKLTVQGTGTSTNWETLLNSFNTDSVFTLAMVKDGFGPSDHASFYTKNIPVLFFFTGVHEDYHKPSDDYDKVNYDGLEQIVRFAVKVSHAIDTLTTRPDFLKTVQPVNTSGGRGFKVTLGTVPDYSEGVVGFKISDVRENGPAQKAGLKGGDIIIKLGKYEIKSIYDFMYSLEGFKPGDETEVVFKRGEETITAKVIFGSRN